MDTDLDLIVVEAINKGDKERYKELVDRHERRVYGVAWSCLGNADLAQEATQEAFMKGFHKLKSLREGTKFSAWITSIARNIAINQAIRHRNELKHRVQWALTQNVSPASQNEQGISSETLQLNLSQLANHHRECLILFYLEGKSISEASQAIGLSETAFKTRLFRARKHLRNKIEGQLADALKGLQPKQAVAPVIMGLVLSQKVQAASSVPLLIKAGTGFTKALPVKLLAKASMMNHLFVSFAMLYGLDRLTLKNFRNKDGFRAKFYNRASTQNILLTPVRMGLCLIGIALAYTFIGKTNTYQVLGFLYLIYILKILLDLRYICNRYRIYMFCGLFALTLPLIAQLFIDLPDDLTAVGMGIFMVFLGLANHHIPGRMDYNLFLRLTQGLIPEQSAKVPPKALSHQDIRSFIRFLGKRSIIAEVRKRKTFYQMRLAPIGKLMQLSEHSFLPWKTTSTLSLFPNGDIKTHLGRRHSKKLAHLPNNTSIQNTKLELALELAISHALDHFLKGHFAEAEQCLGQISEQAIFRVSPRKSKASQLRTVYFIGIGIVLVGLTSYIQLTEHYFYPPRGSRLTSVSAPASRINARLDALGQDPNQASQYWKAMDSHQVPTVSFIHTTLPEKARNHVRSYLLHHISAHKIWQSQKAERIMAGLFEFDFLPLKKAILNGFMQRSDFEEKGLTPETLQKALATRARWLSIQESSVQDRSYSVLMTRQFLDHLHILSLFECEHMLDRPKLIDQLCHHQIIEGNTLEGRKPVQDRAIVNGLFYCSLDDPIRDTYYALAILSQLDGLDQINREACIKGILRLHRGKGLFGSYRKQDKLHIPGDAYDTCYAFESLRLLNALDRIKDLDKWVFRPGSTQITPTLRWQQIEAWLLTEAVQTYGKDRKSNPSLKAPTLLKPGYLADH